MPMVSRSHVTNEITAALTYTNNVREDVPNIIHSDNAKECLAAATLEAPREFLHQYDDDCTPQLGEEWGL